LGFSMSTGNIVANSLTIFSESLFGSGGTSINVQ
jgi:hypothetical protein